jgi:exo-beta-1,3-glucanase (GH17 family)/cellulose synthase/poly-beta-1,6-N-acetylglucosamine synthase-like glycosyltransferase
MFNKANVVITVTIALLTISIWALLNRPEIEPPWPLKIQGFCYSPFRVDQSPLEGVFPTVEQIESDLAMLAKKTHAVRTYSMEETIVEVPKIARKYGINVALGAWIGNDHERNQQEIELLITSAAQNRNVVRAIVGNEVILRGDIPLAEFLPYLIKVRKALNIPVSTTEPWHVWIKNPELAENVDYLGVHLLPYWEGVELDAAVDYCIEKLRELKDAFPDKPIVIAEVGWPSEGRTRQWADASESNEATFLRRFLDYAEKQDHIYYVMEAFDQPWKAESEGAVGAYWGVYDVYRQPKFEFTRPIIKIPEWRTLAGLSVLIAVITLALLVTCSQTLNIRGRSFLAVIAFALAAVSVWATYDYINQYLSVRTVVVGILIVFGMIGVILVLLTEAHEWAEAVWVKERRRPFKPVLVDDAQLPMVSVHIPTYNEPPEMVNRTLDALARMNYPKFEVIVVDNNTRDENVWRPVEDHCRRLGPRFKFFHVDPLTGFKAGALNYALDRTDPEAAIIGVIDSDYEVDPSWLRDLAPQFRTDSLAIVQAPQDYRDESANAFKSMCYAEYRGFFYIGMITRNERNAIIQHGTMSLVRRSALEEVGRWSQWCITEDAELGLRIFEYGYEAMYIPKSYGKGLMPDTFVDYKKQRFRWAYGAMQILRRHKGRLTGLGKSRLTAGQRYHFWAGWLPWIADALNLVFNMGAVVWSLLMIFAPQKFDPPLAIFSIFPLALFCFKVAKLIFIYRGAHIVAGIGQTLSAAIAGLALSHTIARAIWAGLVTSGKPFFRTPKMADAHPFLKAIASSREETLFMVLLWLLAACVALTKTTMSPDLIIWIIVLSMQSLPYLAAFAVSLISAFPGSGQKQAVVPGGMKPAL